MTPNEELILILEKDDVALFKKFIKECEPSENQSYVQICVNLDAINCLQVLGDYTKSERVSHTTIPEMKENIVICQPCAEKHSHPYSDYDEVMHKSILVFFELQKKEWKDKIMGVEDDSVSLKNKQNTWVIVEMVFEGLINDYKKLHKQKEENK